MLASFTMGANDVSNASAALVATRTTGPLLAGVIGGVGLAVGVLVFGGPLLKRVAFDIVKVDASMAVAAQLVQVAVVMTAASGGYFTSMNQALVAAILMSAARASESPAPAARPFTAATTGIGRLWRPSTNGVYRSWMKASMSLGRGSSTDPSA
jgi:phosphate/sulfate permease